MDFDLNERIPNNIDDDSQTKILSDLDEIQQSLNKKVNELNTIKLLQYLKEGYLNCQVSLRVDFDREDNEYTWQCKIVNSNSPNNLYGLGWVIVMSQELTRSHYFKPEISFVNNEIGRDKLIEFMIGENWQQWKKEGEIIEQHEKLSNKIPNKNVVKELKKKI